MYIYHGQRSHLYQAVFEFSALLFTQLTKDRDLRQPQNTYDGLCENLRCGQEI